LDVFGPKALPTEFTVACALFEITPKLGTYHIEGGHGTYTVAGAVSLAVESVGLHSISVGIDGAVAGDIPFQVFLAPGR
jgi:hypothetical protein